MFDNIGEKVKGLSYFICFGGIVVSVISGIVMMFNSMTLIGILILIFGSLFSWISSWVTYAIGEIAENTGRNRISQSQPRPKINTAKAESEKRRMASVLKSVNENPSRRQFCPHCGETVQSNTCGMCGKSNNLFK